MTKSTILLKSRVDADQAITSLEAAGIAESQISVVMTDEARSSHFGLRESSKVDEGVGAGAGVGGLIGAVIAGIAAAGTIAIPGLNLVVAGALVPALAGLGAGAVAGGLIGGLIGSGIPEHEAKIYDNAVRAGHVLLAVDTQNSDEKKAVDRVFHDLKDERAVA